MVENVLLVFDSFDPVSNYKLDLVKEVLENNPSISEVFYFSESYGSEEILSSDERIALLSSVLPNSLSPKHLIDGTSFSNSELSIGKKIQYFREKKPHSQIFLLLDSKEFQILSGGTDWPYLLATTTIVLFVLKEHKHILNSYAVTSQPIIFVNYSDRLNSLSKASIFEVSREAYSDLVIEYMNKSEVVAIKRIKSLLSESRFKHSLRVAGTIKQMCEMNEVEDSEFRYDAYLSAIYHDICKELPQNIQREMSKKELGFDDDVPFKSLHAPLGAWYLKQKYLISNSDILEAIEEHTVPSESPKLLTMYLYLADKLEISKKSRYPEEFYSDIWKKIEEKNVVAAFLMLLDFFN